MAFGVIEIVQQEILNPGEQITAAHKWENLPLVTLDQVPIRVLIPIGPAEFHAVFLGKTFHLPMAKHRQAGHGGHQGADPEILIPFAKLVHCRALVGVVHEIDIALQDLRIELEGVLDHQAVFLRSFRRAAYS